MIVGDSTSRALQLPQAPADVFIEATAVTSSFFDDYAFDVTLTLTGANAADIAADNDASVVLYSDYTGYQTFQLEEEVDGAQVFTAGLLYYLGEEYDVYVYIVDEGDANFIVSVNGGPVTRKADVPTPVRPLALWHQRLTFFRWRLRLCMRTAAT